MNDEELSAAAREVAAGNGAALARLEGHQEFWATAAGSHVLLELSNSPFVEDYLDALLSLGVPPSSLLAGAARQGSLTAIQRLAAAGADPNGEEPETPLMSALTAEAAEALLTLGAEPKGGGYLGMSNVHAVAQRGNLRVLRVLERHGCDIDDDSGNYSGASTPLMCACLGSSFDVVRYLVSRGVELDRRSKKNGKTALHFAIENGQFHTARFLVDKGARLDAVSKTGATPLHACISAGKAAVGMAAHLVEQGAPLDAPDKNGMTPLHLALTKKNKKLVQHLVARGADPDLGLTKAKKVGKTKLEPGATAHDVAAAVGLSDTLTSPQESSFAKELRMTFGDLPPLDAPPESSSGPAPDNVWGPRFWEAFNALPEGFEFPEGAPCRHRLRSMKAGVIDRSSPRLTRFEQLLGVEFSEHFHAFYGVTFDLRVHWAPVGGGYPSGNFRFYAPEEMFSGGKKKPHYLLAAEEHGETLLSFPDGRETLSFRSDHEVLPMGLSFGTYLEALLLARGMHGWQSYFLGSAHRDDVFEADLERLFGQSTREAFLALATASRPEDPNP